MGEDQSEDVQDRTVHARSPLLDLVRYDRAGKWYLELSEKPEIRERKTLAEAVALATQPEFRVFLGKPGGSAFDRKVRAVFGRTGQPDAS